MKSTEYFNTVYQIIYEEQRSKRNLNGSHKDDGKCVVEAEVKCWTFRPL